MAFSEALFYPWIDIRSESWLKTAVLYWECVRTIVPESIRHPYSTEAARALEGEGFLLPLRVNSDMGEIEGLAGDVLRFLASPEGAGVLLSDERYPSSYLHAEKLPYEVREIVEVHRDKLPYEIRNRLSRLDRQDGDWYRVDDRFASFYMTLLATRLSERIGAGLLTPFTAAEKLAFASRLDADLSNLIPRLQGHRSLRLREYEAWGERRPIPHTFVQGMLAHLVLERVAIAPETPVDRLVDFRDRHKDELGRFRKKIGDLASSISSEQPIEHLQQVAIDAYRNEVEPAISDLRRALDGSRIRWLAEGLMKIAFISAGTSSMLVATGLDAPTALLAGAGISLTVTGALYNAEKQKSLRDNPFSYVLRAEREFH